MKRQKKYLDSEYYRLLATLQGFAENSNIVVTRLRRSLHYYSFSNLLSMWEKGKSDVVKEFLEQEIALRYINYECLSSDPLPKAFQDFVSGVTSIDAICTLMQAKRCEIREFATDKYQEFLNDYLEVTEENYFELYLHEGDDSNMISLSKNEKIVPFIKKKH